MAIIHYNGSSDSLSLRSGNAKFNIPTSVEDYAGKTILNPMNSVNLSRKAANSDPQGYRAFDFSTYINDSNPLKKFHQITFYLGNKYILTANLPKNVTYKIGNRYTTPLAFTSNAGLNLLMQSFSGEFSSSGASYSGIPRASTAQIWSGPEPLTLQFDIDVIDDTDSSSRANFQECLKYLGEYVLPSYDGKFLYTNVPYGANLSISYRNKAGNLSSFGGGSGKYIDVLVGGMLYCQYLALRSMTVTYANNKAMLLHNWDKLGGARLLPMTAKISLELMTVEGLIANTYTKMLMLNSNDPNKDRQYNGNFNMDVSSIQDWFSKTNTKSEQAAE